MDGEDWRADAACASHNPGLWFSNNERDIDEARRICRHCRVQQECLSYALRREFHGIWGGMSANERRDLRRLPYVHGTEASFRAHQQRGEVPCGKCQDAWERANEARLITIQHGTRQGYLEHVGLHDKPCDPCRQANARYMQDHHRNQ